MLQLGPKAGYTNYQKPGFFRVTRTDHPNQNGGHLINPWTGHDLKQPKRSRKEEPGAEVFLYPWSFTGSNESLCWKNFYECCGPLALWHSPAHLYHWNSCRQNGEVLERKEGGRKEVITKMVTGLKRVKLLTCSSVKLQGFVLGSFIFSDLWRGFLSIFQNPGGSKRCELLTAKTWEVVLGKRMLFLYPCKQMKLLPQWFNLILLVFANPWPTKLSVRKTSWRKRCWTHGDWWRDFFLPENQMKNMQISIQVLQVFGCLVVSLLGFIYFGKWIGKWIFVMFSRCPLFFHRHKKRHLSAFLRRRHHSDCVVKSQRTTNGNAGNSQSHWYSSQGYRCHRCYSPSDTLR